MAKKPSKALTVLAENLERLMEAKRKTMPSVAKDAKMDQKTIWRIIHKQNEPSIDKLEKIAAVFHMEPWQLLVPHLSAEHPPALVGEEVTA